ncbi:DUF3152 domain-containing protein, partial [Streptosporangium algeriense]
DEAEIRGHRRTYVGAQSGRIVRAIREAGSMNPVVLLDEVDKVGSDYRGDPTAALLEVLDPAQNHTFRDHYLEVELDLSDVLFLATANVLEAVPGPLLDRMEVVTLDGYTEDEKVAIARDHLLPRQLDKAGLTAEDVTLGEDALRALAGEYTREAGVRSLERSIARVLRKVIRYVVEVERGLPFDGQKFADEVHRILNDPRSWGFRFQRVRRGPARIRVSLSSPTMTDRMCRPLITFGALSCWNRGRAVINARRWNAGARGYGRDVASYHEYVINHEVGHGLGHGHVRCPGPGRRAPVMLQQTKSLYGCRPNAWPFPGR